MKKEIKTKNAPAAIGPYSQGVSTSGKEIILVSGQLPINPETSEMPETIKEQTEQSLKNLKAIVEEAGGTMASVLKTTVYLDDIKEFGDMNEVYETLFQEPYPARAAFEVAKLPKDAKVEIEAIVSI
jgi:2-iminobutanoate/2-iminopropanoate deaminase